MTTNLDHPPTLQQSGKRVTVSTPYWTVVHDARQGGCPISIKFPFGSRKNLLHQPLDAHLALKRGDQIVFYRQSHCAGATLKAEQTDQAIQVTLAGAFQDEGGQTLPVRYEQTYRYERGGLVRVRLTLAIEQPLAEVYEIGACRFCLRRDVDTIGLRPGLPPPPPPENYYATEAMLRWSEPPPAGSYQQQVVANEPFIPTWFALFAKDVEGIEFWRSDDGEAWDRPFGVAAGQAVFLDDSRKYQDCRFIRLEPFCNWSDPQPLAPGSVTWEYSLGLPFVKEQRLARKLVFHAGICSQEWPPDDMLKSWADAGVSLVRLHDDDSRIQPSWRNCFYPPYDPANMQRLDHVIAQCHRLGMKIVPYFSLKHFHWDCPEYQEQAPHWQRWLQPDGRIETEVAYGGYMCMKSGWLEFKKQTIDLVLRHHAFDGVYYDHMWYRFCRHPEHAAGHWHTDADEVLDFMRWTRDRVGPDGVVFIHTSGCPGFVFENLSDLIFIGEDMPYARLLPGGHPPDLPFVPIAPRNWVPAGRHFVGDGPEARRCFLIQMLEGCPTCGVGSSYQNLSPFLRRQFGLFRPYDLGQFQFWRASERPVRTGHKSVAAALLAGPNEALVYCANLGARDVNTVLRVSSRCLGWTTGPLSVSVPANDAILVPLKKG